VEQNAVPPEDSDFYGFVAQVNDEQNSNPIPTINSWLDMGRLLTQDLGFGFATPATLKAKPDLVSPYDAEHSTEHHSVGTVNDHDLGNRIRRRYGGFDRRLIHERPKAADNRAVQDVQDGSNTGITMTASPGFATSVAIQYWNTSGNTPSPGASISVEVDYVVPSHELAQAVHLGLLNSRRHRYLQETINIGPQPTAVLGAARFIVADPTTAA